MKKEKYPEKAIEYLDEKFPKGKTKFRGEAMCLLALAFLEGKEIGRKEKKKWKKK